VRTLAILTIAAACKGKAPAPAPEQPPPTPPTTPATAPAAVAADAGSTATDWTSTCDETLRTAATIPAPRRALAVIDACRPCGTWTPLLAWNVPPGEGGPTRAAIEEAMAACDGYCDANGKQRFLGNLDPARGVDTRTPWRMLGDACKDKVSAVPDSRFMSAPYFALDRIARAIGKRPEGAKLLAGVVVPLPALTISGVGIDLPEAPVVKPSEAPAQLTVLDVVYASRLPLASLAVDGVHLPADATYPGSAAKDLAAELDKLGDPVLVFAPRNSPAQRLPAAIAKAGKHTLFLAAKARGGPPGWQMYGAVPIQLVAKAAKPGVTVRMTGEVDDLIKTVKAMPPAELQKGTVTIALGPKTTIAEVARLLGALAFFDVPAVTLVASP